MCECRASELSGEFLEGQNRMKGGTSRESKSWGGEGFRDGGLLATQGSAEPVSALPHILGPGRSLCFLEGLVCCPLLEPTAGAFVPLEVWRLSYTQVPPPWQRLGLEYGWI